MSFTRTSLTMQVNGSPISEGPSDEYCQALMTVTTVTNNGVKPVPVKYVHPSQKSHLVTSRAYTASKLTSNYVSEMSGERLSERRGGTVPPAKSEMDNGLTYAAGYNLPNHRKDSSHVDTNNDEYVQFIHPSRDANHLANLLETEKTETQLVRFGVNQTNSPVFTPPENIANDVVYCEIKDNDDSECNNILFPSGRHSQVDQLRVECNRSLQRVSQLTREKQEMVYKLRDFVETNAELHAEVERSHAAISELKSQLYDLECALEHEQSQKILISKRLEELSSLQAATSEHHGFKLLSSTSDISSQKLDCPGNNTGESESTGSSLSSGVPAELRQAVQLATDQQRQLESLRDVVARQNGYIGKLCQRDVSLGLEIRQSVAGLDQNDAITPTSLNANTSVASPGAAGEVYIQTAVWPPLTQEVAPSEDVFTAPSTIAAAVHSHHLPTTSSPRPGLDPGFTVTHLPPPPAPCYDRRVPRRSPPPPSRPGIETPSTRSSSHTAPARALGGAEPQLMGAVATGHVDLESLPMGFEMTTACPICQTPIPYDATSSNEFSRHVDECISRVTGEGPPAAAVRSPSNAAASSGRTCPVCNVTFPTDTLSQADFERHVDDHFADDDAAAQRFEPLVR